MCGSMCTRMAKTGGTMTMPIGYAQAPVRHASTQPERPLHIAVCPQGLMYSCRQKYETRERDHTGVMR